MHGDNSESLLAARLTDFLKQHVVFSKRLQVLGLVAFKVDDDPKEHFLKLEFSSCPPIQNKDDHLSTSPGSPATELNLDVSLSDDFGKRDRRKSRKPQRQLLPYPAPLLPSLELDVKASPLLISVKNESNSFLDDPPVLKPSPNLLPSLTPSSDLLPRKHVSLKSQPRPPTLINSFTIVDQTPVLGTIFTNLQAQTPLKTIHPAPTGLSISNRRHSLHRNSKVHKCRYCCKIFNRKFCRERHERLHTGVKPYECSICDEKFIRLEDKKRHVRINHQVESLTGASSPTVMIDDLL